MSEHRESPRADVHAVVRHAFANKPALDGDTADYFASEVDIQALLVDRKAIFRLTNHSPRTWTNLVAGRKEASAVAPGVTNDIDEGYDVGSIWADTTGVDAYICIDNSAGAAVWVAASSGGAPAFPLLAPDGTAGAPSYSFSGGSTKGIFSNGTDVAISVGSTEAVHWDTSQIQHNAASIQTVSTDANPGYGFALDPDTGVHCDQIGVLEFNTAGISRGNFTSAAFTSNVEIRFLGGSAADPGLQPIGDPNSGVFGLGSDVVGVATAGTEAIRWNSAQQTLVAAGAVGTPAMAFFDQQNTGWYRQIANGWTFSANGVRSWDIASTLIAFNFGTESVPTHAWTTDTGTGTWRPAASTYAISTGGTEAVRWNSSQQTLASAGSQSAPAYSTAGNVDMGIFFPTDAVAITINNLETVRWDASFQTNTKSVGASTVDADIALMLLNPTAAAAGAQQHSPILVLEGQGWKTNATAATQEVQFGLQVIPVEGAANPTGELNFYSNINDAGFVERLSLTSSGDLEVSNDVDASGGFRRTQHLKTTVAVSTTKNIAHGTSASGNDDDGWIICARAGSVVELAAAVNTDVTAGNIDIWVQKSTDGGDSFSDLWGTAAAPVLKLTTGATAEVDTATVAKDTNTFAVGDILRVRVAFDGSIAGANRLQADFTIEC